MTVEAVRDAPSSPRQAVLTAETAPGHQINLGAFPSGLTNLPRWVAWKWHWNGRKWTKVPIRLSGHNASCVDPAHWSDFSTVSESAGRNEWGIGFVFNGDGIVGIDIDDCRDPDSGEVQQWANQIIQTLDTYTEISPSATGVKLFLRGELPEQFRKKHERHDGRGAVEIFREGRFFTVTGQRYAQTPGIVNNRPRELMDVYGDVSAWVPTTIATTPRVLPPPAATSPFEPETGDRVTALAALAAISNNPGLHYDDWLAVGMALHSVESSEGMRSEWEAWSRTSSKFVEGECSRKWASFSGSGVGIGTGPAAIKSWRP